MSRLFVGEPQPLEFGIYVPSAILKNGSLIVSWATGQKATTQIDYGTDPGVPNTTGIKLLDEDDEGFVAGKDIPLLQRYHNVPFPQTFIDTTHYFRVRSSNIDGDVLESDVYSVYVNDELTIETIFPVQFLGAAEAVFVPAALMPRPGLAIDVQFNSSGLDETIPAAFAGSGPSPSLSARPQNALPTLTTEILTTVEPI